MPSLRWHGVCFLALSATVPAPKRDAGLSHAERLMSESPNDELVPHARQIGRYANIFRVGFNAFEMVVEFGEQFADSEQPQMHTRVITNPVFARGLAESLNDALARYADTYSSEPPGT